ncbi:MULTISPECIES: GGDEF domain-containing protein [unclassified Pseudodesulfovibrio]|uniref:GGDEF domain-containing protein n=1 Tax=unclassified Pseudodesulfovibrio TaxID=2661612 RepID=UPI0013E2F908|nr:MULTISPECIES: GGDEF domain-containing protein [unclassified Pseudodesulfovibrio]MCJ2166107.1 GGDEF domain-containing protein [Pseudodesulfovibrio sp. S3-i]
MLQTIEQQARINSMGLLADPQAERDFQTARLPYTRRRLRFVCVITAAAYLGAIYADSLQISDSSFTLLLAARLLTALTGLVPFILTFSKNTTPFKLGLSACAYMVVLMATEALELYLKSDTNSMRETPITIFIVLMFYLFQAPQIWQPVIAGGLGSVAYILTLVLCTNAPPDYISNTALTFALANGFGFYFCIRFGAAQRREFFALTELKHKAETDVLTGILNRRRVMELGEREFRAAKRYDHACSLLLIDVDHFKKINDSLGHAAGDDVLVSIAKRCVATLRQVDIFGRVGGEEFALFMPHSTKNQAIQAAERLRKSIGDSPFTTGENALTVTISIGVAEMTPEMDTLDALFRQADNALYEAKRRGRNSVHAD